jgi:uncharacterized protein YecE (DUF72 family)
VRLWVGTSGYSYKEWRGKFYPPRLPGKEMLRFYASRFAAVEINNSFYRLPKETVLQSWSEQVPTDFRFVLKAPRRITHTKRLSDAGAGVEDLFNVAAALGLRQGAILFQLPPNFKKDVERLRTFLSLLPADRHVAFEFRHPSWLVEEVFAMLRARNCALCVADTDESESCEPINTASWGYLRLRRRDYRAADLLHWKERISSQAWDHAYVFFKHEDEATGPKFANKFLQIGGDVPHNRLVSMKG